ncbi:hypothetical protein COCMIDRAFT_4420 [Bipolaris oryzae ATCC 44560]|uniref:Hydrophobin n=1 Tax=Bipolaris oryzae ATCC 44560 TaxID=930090 RepID=W6Z9P9_COCMI|nr:uncharacterized protein COCMIDRAFT_4420 [Bipolaris oryzae ATCC 44560]EUC46513.1 hypothetical protein COCMIDRAFT_4420 [Bipolaris oryzae ATCC 44560]
MKITTFLTTLVVLTPTVFARCLILGSGNGQTCPLTATVITCDLGSTPGLFSCKQIPQTTSYCCLTAQ